MVWSKIPYGRCRAVRWRVASPKGRSLVFRAPLGGSLHLVTSSMPPAAAFAVWTRPPCAFLSRNTGPAAPGRQASPVPPHQASGWHPLRCGGGVADLAPPVICFGWHPHTCAPEPLNPKMLPSFVHFLGNASRYRKNHRGRLVAFSERSMIQKLFLFFLSSATLALADTEKPPNIVFVMTDDQRWDSFGCYGRPEYKTENIDKLLQRGLPLTTHFTRWRSVVRVVRR